MKKVLIYLAVLMVLSCGGDDLSNNCGDGILQPDEVCEIGMQTHCIALGYLPDNSGHSATVLCGENCDGWNISVCETGE